MNKALTPIQGVVKSGANRKTAENSPLSAQSPRSLPCFLCLPHAFYGAISAGIAVKSFFSTFSLVLITPWTPIQGFLKVQ
jgi:hypothetical protein